MVIVAVEMPAERSAAHRALLAGGYEYGAGEASRPNLIMSLDSAGWLPKGTSLAVSRRRRSMRASPSLPGHRTGWHGRRIAGPPKARTARRWATLPPQPSAHMTSSARKLSLE